MKTNVSRTKSRDEIATCIIHRGWGYPKTSAEVSKFSSLYYKFQELQVPKFRNIFLKTISKLGHFNKKKFFFFHFSKNKKILPFVFPRNIFYA